MSEPHVLSIHIGKISPLGPDNVPSGFIKHAVRNCVTVTHLGLVGDEQADLSVHGGAEKAVYAYPFDHYEQWQREYPQHVSTLIPGGFGENLCVGGLKEVDICVGDIHRVGTSTLQVCQPRQPCFKLALRFEDKLLPKAMIRTGRAGWYYRVLEPGELRAGDPIRLEHRPNPDFRFSRLVEVISHRDPTRDELERLKDMPGLATHWQERARKWLQAVAQP
jgi:MOSC domain-containing protein YiiM